AYFAIQNIHPVTVVLANVPLTGIPLYIIAVGSLLVGLAISFVLSLFGAFSSFLELRGKDATITDARNTIAKLRQENQNLRVENANLRGRSETGHDKVIIEKKPTYTPTLMQRLRNNF